MLGQYLMQRLQRVCDRCFMSSNAVSFPVLHCLWETKSSSYGAVSDARRAGHRDIKPSNLLASPGGRLLLIDFGSAAAMGVAGRAGYQRDASPVDPNWSAPESFVDEDSWAAFDVYSVGLVMWPRPCAESCQHHSLNSAGNIH
jgi:serine/threonine protein kinase